MSLADFSSERGDDTNHPKPFWESILDFASSEYASVALGTTDYVVECANTLGRASRGVASVCAALLDCPNDISFSY